MLNLISGGFEFLFDVAKTCELILVLFFPHAILQPEEKTSPFSFLFLFLFLLLFSSQLKHKSESFSGIGLSPKI